MEILSRIYQNHQIFPKNETQQGKMKDVIDVMQAQSLKMDQIPVITHVTDYK